MDKKEFDADRTIQLDQIDPAEVPLESNPNVVPPPLPPEALLPSKPPSAPPPSMHPSVRPLAPPPKKSPTKTLVLVGVFLVLLVGMIFLGLKLGDIVHPEQPAASAAPSATPHASIAASVAAPSATPSVQEITLPTIEMR